LGSAIRSRSSSSRCPGRCTSMTSVSMRGKRSTLELAGANYGWPATEGETSDPNFRSPLYAYSHSEGCSIAGGAFHNPLTPHFPLAYWGAYFFDDFCGG
jgi:hypothetical protein